MPQTPAPTRANVRQSATWRISDTNLSPPCQLTTHAADSMLFLSKSRLFGFLPTKFPEYPTNATLAPDAPSGIIVGRFEAARQSPQGTLEPPPCLKPPPRRGQTFDKARLGASPIRISAHPASSQPMLRIPCFSSLKAVFSDFYPLNSRNIPHEWVH